MGEEVTGWRDDIAWLFALIALVAIVSLLDKIARSLRSIHEELVEIRISTGESLASLHAIESERPRSTHADFRPL